MDDRRSLEPTELIYQPSPSWGPLFLAAGVAGVIVGLFSSWIYAIVGLVVSVIALALWARDTREDLGRMPRRQRATTAVLPAKPLRSSRRTPRERP